jgi:hypothetical protein
MLLNCFSKITQDAKINLDFLSLLRDMVVVVGTILGVCMTILWTMDFNNLQGLGSILKKNINHHEINTYRGFWALYMLTLFLFILLSLGIWLGVPLGKRIGLW